VSDDVTAEAADWAQRTATEKGSWWPDFAGWLVERSGRDKPAPQELGNERFPAIDEAPGSYVLDT
jgi:polyhydroxyalkanoate synthase